MSASIGRLFLKRIELIFATVVLAAIGGVWAYQAFVTGPVERCENSGNWWDGQTHTCGHVVYLPDITHRPTGGRSVSYPTLPQTAAQAAGGASGAP